MRDSWGTYDGRQEEPPYDTMSDEPKQAPERVFVVRLTEDDRIRSKALGFGVRDSTSLWLLEKIHSARPEHLYRQAALERLLAACRKLRTAYDFEEEAVSGSDATIAINSEFLEALDDLEIK